MTPALKDQLRQHAQWRARGVRAIQDLRAWLCEVSPPDADTDARLARAIRAVQSDRVVVVFCGEQQRGKSELINALFFADYGRRLLPVGGDPSACTTELFWDRSTNDAYLRLLPIESRDEDASVAALKTRPDRWAHFPLRPQEPAQMRTLLEEIHQYKTISRAQAARLGLAGLEPASASPGDQIRVPRWRHALISFPHPLLKKGLLIYDMPGLDALDHDPESARTILDAAHTCVFAVDARVGVERADLTLWQQYLHGFRSERRNTILVALTKADDGRREPAVDPDDVERQRRRVARALGAAESMILPVSARNGLAAKIADKPSRLRGSGIEELELLIAERLVDNKHAICRRTVQTEVGALIERNVTQLSARLHSVNEQVDSLSASLDRGAALLSRLLTHTRRDQERYLRAVRLFQSARAELLESAAPCRQLLETAHFERLVTQTHRRMTRSWSTAGISRAMATLFDELRAIVARTSGDGERLHQRLVEVYSGMQTQLGLGVTVPGVLKPTRYRSEMELLHAEARAFRNGPDMLLAEQGVAITRFHRRLVDRARILLEQLRDEWDAWMRASLEPMAAEIQRFKQETEQRLDRLQQLNQSREEAKAQIVALRHEGIRLAKQMTLLRNIRNTLQYQPEALPRQKPGPYLVTRDGQAV